jgi:protein FAM50
LQNPPPKAQTKVAKAAEELQRAALRREFLINLERLKRTPMLIPFVFYDGTAIPAGTCKILKGDAVWLFLEKARKMGARQDLGGATSSLKGWARVSVDDLVLVRGDVIIPHHYDFSHFIMERPRGPDGQVLFDFSKEVTDASPVLQLEEEQTDATLTKPTKKSVPDDGALTEADLRLEGADHEPEFTKVVDRRWYEKNKHIFPASAWLEYEPGRSYEKEVRRDPGGNTYFF